MKCKYCWKETDKEYCDFDCRKAYLDYNDDIDKSAEHQKPLLIMSVIISAPFIVLFYGLGVTVMCALIGLTLITHPFIPSDKRKRMSPKDAKTRMTVIGILIIVIGIPFLLLTGTWLDL